VVIVLELTLKVTAAIAQVGFTVRRRVGVLGCVVTGPG
jgi:hypothetical protein